MNQQTNVLYVVARALMSAIFLTAGIRKIMAYAGTVTYFGNLGIPMPDIVVPLAIAVEVGGGAALILGWQTRYVAIVLAVFTVAAGLIAHRFWAVDAAQFGNQLNHFLKNIAMVGGFLVIVVIEAIRVDASRAITANVNPARG